MEALIPMLPPTVGEVAKANMPRIIKGNELAVTLLRGIQKSTITTEEQRAEAVAAMTKSKAVFDKVDLLVKEVVEPIEVFIESIKAYKKTIDYKSTAKDGNEYTKAREVIEAYDQAKSKEIERLKAEAEILRNVNLLKAEIKEGVGKRVIGMLAGQKKNIIDGMSRWEAALTLENIDASYEKLGGKVPTLTQEKWELCFNIDFVSPLKKYMTPDATKAYMDELKKEFQYEQYNKEYAEIVSPILNEYRAKQEQTRGKLKEIREAGESERKRLEEERKAALELKATEDRKAVDEAAAIATEAVEHQKEMDNMDAVFTEQMQTQDLYVGPMRRVAMFENTDHFLKPFAAVIGACVLNSKFPGILKKNGVDLIDSVQWWMDWFGANCKEEIKGVVVKEVPKTIIRQAK